MAFYECMVIARQELSQAAAETLLKDFQKIITDGKGKILKTEMWGLKDFAYKINKQRKGHYMLMELDTAPEALLEMERRMRLHEDIVRYLTIKLDAPSEAKQPAKKEAA